MTLRNRKPRSRKARQLRQSRALHLESLEDRRLLATFYVSSTGSDGNAGTMGSPFRTIQAGITAAAAVSDGADTVNVESGTYSTAAVDERFDIPASANLDSLDLLGGWTVGFGARTPAVTPTDYTFTNSPAANRYDVQVLDPGTTIDGFTFRSSNGVAVRDADTILTLTTGVTISNNIFYTGIRSGGSRPVGVVTGAADNSGLTVMSNTFHIDASVPTFTKSAIGVFINPSSQATPITIDGNTFSGNNMNAAVIVSGADNVDIQNNMVTRSTGFFGYGIELRNTSAAVSDVNVLDNTVLDTDPASVAYGIALGEIDAAATMAMSDITVRGNEVSMTGAGNIAAFLAGVGTDASSTLVELNSFVHPTAGATAVSVEAGIDVSGNWFGSSTAAGVDTAISAYTAGPNSNASATIVAKSFLSSGTDASPGTPGFQLPGTTEMLVPETAATSGLAEVDGMIQSGLDHAVPGMTVRVAADTYDEGPQIAIVKDVSLVGAGIGATIVRPTGDTGSSGDARGWFLVDSGVVLDVSDMTFDGNGFRVWQAFRHRGSGTFDSVAFNDIQFDSSGPSYAGTAIAAFGATSDVDVTNSFFTDIGRVGVLYFGSGTTGVFSGNSYTGKGVGDHLDYAVEAGAGAVVEISGNMISGNRGVASSDGSTSAGILATTFFGAGTAVDVHDNDITDNTSGIALGYDSSDTTLATIRDNTITGNDKGVRIVGSTALLEGNDLTGNAEDGLLVSDGAIVDAGQDGSYGNFTGLGISGGGNNFGSYTPIGSAFAIRNENMNTPNDGAGPQGAPYDLTAQGNIFYSINTADIEMVVDHDVDDSLQGFVDFSEPLPVYVQDGMLFIIGTGDNDDISVTLKKGRSHCGWHGGHEEPMLVIRVKTNDHGHHHGWHHGSHGGDTYLIPAAGITKIVIYGLAGDDKIKVDDKVKINAFLFGGDGNDDLYGGGGCNVLVGGADNDYLAGGKRRDILIGGTGRDNLKGERGPDLLIGGTTSADDDLATLDAALAEWKDDDLSGVLSLLTVSDDAERDKLRGGKGPDTFFDGVGDRLKDVRPGQGDMVVV